MLDQIAFRHLRPRFIAASRPYWREVHTGSTLLSAARGILLSVGVVPASAGRAAAMNWRRLIMHPFPPYRPRFRVPRSFQQSRDRPARGVAHDKAVLQFMDRAGNGC
jgi:hypothetical protein